MLIDTIKYTVNVQLRKIYNSSSSHKEISVSAATGGWAKIPSLPSTSSSLHWMKKGPVVNISYTVSWTGDHCLLLQQALQQLKNMWDQPDLTHLSGCVWDATNNINRRQLLYIQNSSKSMYINSACHHTCKLVSIRSRIPFTLLLPNANDNSVLNLMQIATHDASYVLFHIQLTLDWAQLFCLDFFFPKLLVKITAIIFTSKDWHTVSKTVFSYSFSFKIAVILENSYLHI